VRAGRRSAAATAADQQQDDQAQQQETAAGAIDKNARVPSVNLIWSPIRRG